MRDGAFSWAEPASDVSPKRLIPISVITGFLGSGKTTLISRVLRDPAFTRTAVIVNEFGDVGLDHDLIASSNDASVVALSSGCLCCAIQTDLAKTLMGLLERRDAGTARFDRVLVETSGLSDPVPILQTIIGNADIAGTHRLAAVVTVVDPIHGERTLEEHSEARHQVAFADTLLISKTDLCAPSDQLLERLEMLNADARRTTTASVDPSVLFYNPSSVNIAQRLAVFPRQQGHNDIQTFAVTRDKPLRALSLTMLLQAIAEHCGERLLRIQRSRCG